MGLINILVIVIVIWIIVGFAYSIYLFNTMLDPMEEICQQEGFEEYDCKGNYCNCFTKENGTITISQDYKCDEIPAGKVVIDLFTFNWSNQECRKVILNDRS